MDDVHDSAALRAPRNEYEEQEAEKKDLDSGRQHRRHQDTEVNKKVSVHLCLGVSGACVERSHDD